MSPAELLEATADFVATHPWHSGGPVGDGKVGHYCALEAMAVVNKGMEDEPFDDAVEAMESRLGEVLTTWNDNQTDKRRVISCLRRVARELKSAQSAENPAACGTDPE